MDAIAIDGSSHSGSGTIVRQAVAYAALTGRPVRIWNVRARRPTPGLRPQHLRVVQAVQELVGGELEGAAVGSQELAFQPGDGAPRGRYSFDVGTAGSGCALALALLPVLLLRSQDRVQVQLVGGLFQDHAPSAFHLEHVLVPLLGRMSARVRVRMVRPGYVPQGGGVLQLAVEPLDGPLTPPSGWEAGPVRRVWGIALASHLAGRRVAARMAAAARGHLDAAGYQAVIEEREDAHAAQPGAAIALFADLAGGARLGADQAGAPRRSAEWVGAQAAVQLLEELASGATVDRYAADQLIPFAALAAGETRVRIPAVTDHVDSGAWLAQLFLGASVRVDGGVLTVSGQGWAGPRHR